MRKLYYIESTSEDVVPGLSIIKDIASPPFSLTYHLQYIVVLLGCWPPDSPRMGTTGVGTICRQHLTVSLRTTLSCKSFSELGKFFQKQPQQTSPLILLVRIASLYQTQLKHIVREMR